MQKFIIALSDNQGHMHIIYANVPQEEFENLEKKINSWRPKTTPDPPYCDYISAEEVFTSLKKLTGYDFEYLRPDFYVSYGGTSIRMESTYSW